MRISVGAGTYVLAVSGGVDSMVLLDLLHKRPGVKLIVAHYDHGIRTDSAKDRRLVQAAAKKYRVSFVHEAGKLGPATSEAQARAARYKFLENVRRASGAKGIMTAHHQDDVLETVMINLLRGSGRRGLTSLKTGDALIRPLLDYSKAQIRDYAETHAISWREDSTNTDTKILRNYVRAKILPKFSPGQRAELVILLEGMRGINDELDSHVAALLHIQPALDKLNRAWFILLPHSVAKEVLHAWLRHHKVHAVTKKTIERLVVAMKTGKLGQKIDIDHKHVLKISRNYLALAPIER